MEIKKVKLIDGIQSSKQKTSQYMKWVGIVIVIVIIGALSGLYWNSQKKISQIQNELNSVKADPVSQSKQEDMDLVSKIKNLIVLPNDEQPTIATVTDLEKLQNQPFFKNAKLGDKVLIYTVAKKAILYRPTENKIIELAPLNDENVSAGLN